MRAQSAIDVIFGIIGNIIGLIEGNPILAAVCGLTVIAAVFGVLMLIFGNRSGD